MKNFIYLDNNATTQLYPEVKKAYLKALKLDLYNPSSNHFLGKKTKVHIIKAREKIAKLLKVSKEEIIFTSGGTEGINLAINGILDLEEKGHIISTKLEHACIDKNLLKLEEKGFEISYINKDLPQGPSFEGVKDAIRNDTKLIILSLANSETGLITDIEKIASLAKEHNIAFIVDAVQALGKIKFQITEGISAMVFSGHKIHGPSGIGFLYLSSKVKFSPWILGGDQEYGKRAGTENILGIIALQKALELTYENLDKNIYKMQKLKEKFIKILKKKIKITINGEGESICNTVNIAFDKINAFDLLMQLDMQKVICSHSSACNSHTPIPSKVLSNMGYSEKRVKSSIRFSFSDLNTIREIKKAAKIIIKSIKKMESLSSF